MIELFIIWKLIKHIGRILNDKGHKALGYQVLGVVCWTGGEVMGALLGLVVFGEAGIMTYVAALVGAVAGAVLAIQVAEYVPGLKVAESQKHLWNIVAPVGALLLAGVCVFMSIGATAIHWMVTSPPLQATSVQIGSRLLLDQSIAADSEIDQHTRIIYVGYELDTPDGNAVPVTIEWQRGGVLASQKAEELPGYHLVEFDAYDFPDGYLSPGEYRVVIRVENEVLSDLALTVK